MSEVADFRRAGKEPAPLAPHPWAYGPPQPLDPESGWACELHEGEHTSAADCAQAIDEELELERADLKSAEHRLEDARDEVDDSEQAITKLEAARAKLDRSRAPLPGQIGIPE